MLSFELFFSDKSREVLPHVLSVKLDCQLDVPADSLTLTLPFAKKYREAVLAAAWEGDILRFYGPVDEVITVSQSGKHILRLYARSLAAFLLDNEAEPLTYANPSNKLMAERHLLPFGVTEMTTSGIRSMTACRSTRECPIGRRWSGFAESVTVRCRALRESGRISRALCVRARLFSEKTACGITPFASAAALAA